MPNYVKNNITVIGTNDKIYECLDFCKSDDSEFDFNKIVPMPEELNIDESSKNNQAIKYYLFTLNDEDANKVHNILKTVPDLFHGNLEELNKSGWDFVENVNESANDYLPIVAPDVNEKKIFVLKRYR